MTVAISEQERLTLVHETGYWRVLIRPTVFEERRIPTLSACWRIVEEAKVRLRGWDYPHIDRHERIPGNDWIQSGSTFANHVELWRFFQSGQFLHHLSLREDRTPPGGSVGGNPAPIVTGEPRQLSVLSTLYSITEILVFARNLAYREVLEPAADITIELHGMEGRILTAPFDRDLHDRYQATTDVICWHETLPAATLLATATDLALDATVHVFERFGWEEPPRAVLAEDHRRLLERRL
ncbi:MAG: hypothetical protein AB7R89_31150 [Dehalococcoidia bacterium]